MKSNKTSLMAISYFGGSAITIYGACLKIMHQSNASIFLQIGLLVSLIFIVLAIIEIFSSKKINPFERGLWLLGFLCFNVITGFLYLTRARRSIINS
jgi:hypothetical protein